MTAEGDDDGQLIVSAMLDLSLDPPLEPPGPGETLGQSSAATATGAPLDAFANFEQRGVSLGFLKRMACTARAWRNRRRVSLRDSGATGIVLRDEPGGDVWVQTRCIIGATRDARTIERSYRRVTSAEVERTLIIAIGERVRVSPMEPPGSTVQERLAAFLTGACGLAQPLADHIISFEDVDRCVCACVFCLNVTGPMHVADS